MTLHQHLPIYKLAVDLLDLAVDLTRNMPRDFKASLGAEIRGELIRLIVLIGRANAATDKVPHITELLEHLQVAELSPGAQRLIAAGATRTKPAAAPAAPASQLRCALWSTGELHLARGEVTVILSPAEARTLVDYCRAWAAHVPAAA